MKFLAIFVLALAVTQAVESKVLPQKSHVDCKKHSDRLWPDYEDNRFYFECVGGEHFVKRPCPSTLVFNFYAQECVWLEDWSEPPGVADLILSDFSPTCLEHELHWLWPDPTEASDFFRCTGVGQYERLSCPPGTVFVFLIQMCASPETTTTSTTTKLPVDRYPSCQEHELHLTWPDPWYEENFFICTGIGTSELRECPEGTVFVFMLQMCTERNGEVTWPTFPTGPTQPPEMTSPVTQPTSSSPVTLPTTPSTVTLPVTTTLSSTLRTTTTTEEISSSTTTKTEETSRSTLPVTFPSIPTYSVTRPTNPWTTPTIPTVPSIPTLPTFRPPTTTSRSTITDTEAPTSSHSTPDATTDVGTTQIRTTTDALQTAPTVYGPVVKCVICWRPNCDRHELHLTWPDVDEPRNYFKCLREGEFVLKRCRRNFVFYFDLQRCVRSE